MQLINFSSFKNSVQMFLPHQLINTNEDKLVKLSVQPTAHVCIESYMQVSRERQKIAMT